MTQATKATLLAAGAAFLFGMTSSLLSAPAERFDHVVRSKFFAGFAGDKAAFEEGMRICEQILATEPNHAEALVWSGGGLFSQAGAAFQAGDIARGQELLTRGIERMDRAVSLAPDNIGVRVPRGAVLLTGSRFMPAEMAGPFRERGLADYEHVLNLHGDRFQTIGEHPRGELLLGLGDGWSRAGDTAKATMYFERLAKELPNTAYAKRAAKWLDAKSLSPREAGCIGCHVGKQ